MPKVRTRLPNVFVGHPFSQRFPIKKFRRIFKDLPFNPIYGNTNLQTRHLLEIMKNNINKCDYAIFDLSDWNPNVALELGLSEGLKKKTLKGYYIILNTKRSNEVPSDIRGLQRLEYTSYDFKPDTGLGDQLAKSILSKEFWVRKITKHLANSQKLDKKILLSLKILAHLRDLVVLSLDNVKSLAKGTHLRKQDYDEVLDCLSDLNLIQRRRNSKVYILRRNIYKTI